MWPVTEIGCIVKEWRVNLTYRGVWEIHALKLQNVDVTKPLTYLSVGKKTLDFREWSLCADNLIGPSYIALCVDWKLAMWIWKWSCIWTEIRLIHLMIGSWWHNLAFVIKRWADMIEYIYPCITCHWTSIKHVVLFIRPVLDQCNMDTIFTCNSGYCCGMF